jgi:hypothetical protein
VAWRKIRESVLRRGGGGEGGRGWRGEKSAKSVLRTGWEMSVIREKEISERGRGRRDDKSTKNCRNVKVETNFPPLPSMNTRKL